MRPRSKSISSRTLSYTEAIREAFDIALSRDTRVFLIGEGIPDPKGAFGTTLGLQQKYGRNRVMDMPVSENGMTGVVIGAAIAGMRPVLTHMRVDFSLLSMDQIVNVAAKWRFMFGGTGSVPITIRMIIGRGWGQGPQHSQSLQALFGNIPGLKVVLPATPADAKGLLLASIADNNPVIFIEHRWLHGIKGYVPVGYYTYPIGKAKVVRKGKDISIIATSHMVVESARALDLVAKLHVTGDLIDIRSMKPLDEGAIRASVSRTGKLLVADTGVDTFGFTGEVISRVALAGIPLTSAPRRICLPDYPTPTSWTLAERYYPTYRDIARAILEMVGIRKSRILLFLRQHVPEPDVRSDVPDPHFTGPF